MYFIHAHYSLSIVMPRKFKRGIGSLFDPVLTLWAAAILARHVWSRVIVPPDFFDSALMRVTIVTISRRQSTEVSSRMVSAKTHVATSAWYVLFFFFFSCSVLRFPNLPGKGTAIPPPFSLHFKCCVWHVWRYPEHRKVWILYTVSFYLLIT